MYGHARLSQTRLIKVQNNKNNNKNSLINVIFFTPLILFN